MTSDDNAPDGNILIIDNHVEDAPNRRNYREPSPNAPAVLLGHHVQVQYTSWGPHEAVGALIYHLTPGGRPCVGSILFDLEGVADAFPHRARWTLNSLDPLDINPSVRCSCGHHGWIRNGAWVPADAG